MNNNTSKTEFCGEYRYKIAKYTQGEWHQQQHQHEKGDNNKRGSKLEPIVCAVQFVVVANSTK